MAPFRIPAFKAHLQVELIEPDGVFLLAEDEVSWLGGRLYRALAPLLDGRRTVDDIIEALDGRHTAAEVYHGLERLAGRGYLIEAEPDVPANRAAYWHSLGVAPGRAAVALTEGEVRVLSLGESPVGPILDALRVEGVRSAEHGARLTLVLVDDYLHPSLAGLNREALRSGQPWLLARTTGRTVWLGPRFVPGKVACWECLAQRLRANRPVHLFLQRRRPGAPLLHPARASSEGSMRAAAHLLASAVARGMVTGEDGLAGTLVTVDTVRLRAEHHAVVRRPQCPACGDPGAVAAGQERPLRLERRRKAFTGDGGHRLTSPEETLRLYGHHVSAVTGVVQRLEQIHGGEGELAPVFDSGPNLARSSEELHFLMRTLRGRSRGKGMTSSQARASGVCEAIERYCGVFQGDEARRRDTLHGLGSDALHPDRLLGFSERQYRDREAWNATHAPRARVPHPFEEERRVEWSPVWSLTHGARRYVPTAFCYYGYPEEAPPFCWADSNGCAAGNSLEEAILQGFLELAERDGVALWWYNRARRPRVDLESFDEPYFRRLVDYYRTLDRELWVLDLTSDLGIPTFAAISRRVGGSPEQISLGFGAHLEARLGISRALTEMNQFLPALVARGGETPADPEVREWLDTATLAGHPYLAPAEDQPATVAAHQGRPAWSEDLREDVETCVALARRIGLETLILDQTRPDIGLSVARVIVPGLRHMWPRLGPGRLYDVPVGLGWLARPTPEEQINPVGIFF